MNDVEWVRAPNLPDTVSEDDLARMLEHVKNATFQISFESGRIDTMTLRPEQFNIARSFFLFVDTRTTDVPTLGPPPPVFDTKTLEQNAAQSEQDWQQHLKKEKQRGAMATKLACEV